MFLQFPKSLIGGRIFAARPGIEPRFADSESAVLPLDDLAIFTFPQFLVQSLPLVYAYP